MMGTGGRLRVGLIAMIAVCVIGATAQSNRMTTPTLYPYQWRRLEDKMGYCNQTEPMCCENRMDDCNRRITQGGKDHLCYCDKFCHELIYVSDEGIVEPHHPDCCPDYHSVCEDPGEFVNECTPGAIRRDNCNTCNCLDGGGQGPSRWECTDIPCVIEEYLLEEVDQNQNAYGWTPKNYSMFYGLPLSEGVQYYLGAIPAPENVMRITAIKIEPNQVLPFHYDFRDFYDYSPVRNQGRCAVSYAVTTVDIMSDRKAVIDQKSSGRPVTPVRLSLQQLLSCYVGGTCDNPQSLDVSWFYLNKNGLVPEECYPYTSANSDVQSCRRTCANSQRFPEDLVKSTPSYWLPPDEDKIKSEIYNHGPVQAIMTVKPDFYMYSSGVYRDTGIYNIPNPLYPHENPPTGKHAVRIIGWGEEDGVRYWLAINSWGTAWGDNGTFKIRRGTNECDIESAMVGALPAPRVTSFFG